jgi:hypothetical protein
MNESARFIWAGLGRDGWKDLLTLRHQGIDWDYVQYILTSRKLGQLFYSELEQKGRLDILPQGLCGELREQYQRVAAKNLMLFHDLEEFLRVISQEGIPCLIMKGGALIIEGLFNLGERILADIDLLVRPSDLERASQMMSNMLGYSELRLSDAAPWQELHMVNANNSHLELHAELRPVNGVPSENVVKRLWSRARISEYNGSSIMLPAYEDLLLQDAVHASMHHLFSFDYLFPAVTDIARIIKKWGHRVDWPALLQIAEKERTIEHFLVLLLLSERIFLSQELKKARQAIGEHLSDWERPIFPLVNSLLDVMMRRDPVSLDFMVYFLAKASFAEKLDTLKKMLSSHKNLRYVELNQMSFPFPRPRRMDKIIWRFRKIRIGYLRFFYRMARFYRSIDYMPPG